MVDVVSRYENTSNGYIKLYLSDGRVVEEHRFVMEEALGRRLEKNEVVHHIDGDRKNNRIENLEVVLRGKHASDHHRPVVMMKLVCAYCGGVFEREKSKAKSWMRRGQVDFYCNRRCMGKHFGRGRSKGE